MKKTKYGIDASGLVWSLFVGFFIATGLALFFYFYLEKTHPIGALILFWICLPSGVVMLIESMLMIRSSFSGKKKVLPKVVAALSLQGDEKVLEIGCGTGMLLAHLGKALPKGSAIGIDIWRGKDQSSNEEATTRNNLALEGVKNVEVRTQEMQKLDFPDESFDAVAASLSIHNIPERMGREKALIEVSRVLKPGGRLVILDFQRIQEYKETLEHLKWNDIEIGEREYAMFPFTRILTARKPEVITE